MVVDFVYFYCYVVLNVLCFLFVGGSTNSGIVDVKRGIVDVVMVSCNFGVIDFFGLVLMLFVFSGICLVINCVNLVLGIMCVVL